MYLGLRTLEPSPALFRVELATSFARKRRFSSPKITFVDLPSQGPVRPLDVQVGVMGLKFIDPFVSFIIHMMNVPDMETKWEHSLKSEGHRMVEQSRVDWRAKVSKTQKNKEKQIKKAREYLSK